MSNVVDLAVLRRIVDTLADVANDLDSIGESIPPKVHSGPFAEQVLGLMSVVMAHYLELIMRLRLAAYEVLQHMVIYGETRYRNMHAIKRIGGT